VSLCCGFGFYKNNLEVHVKMGPVHSVAVHAGVELKHRPFFSDAEIDEASGPSNGVHGL
jgi:hypothetical protein